MDIMDTGSVPYSTEGYMATSYWDSLSELLFSFGLEKYIVCDVSAMGFPSFESNYVLYMTPTNASMQELTIREYKEKLNKTCFNGPFARYI